MVSSSRRDGGEDDRVPPGVPELLVAEQRGVVGEADEIVGPATISEVSRKESHRPSEDRVDRHRRQRHQRRAAAAEPRPSGGREADVTGSSTAPALRRTVRGLSAFDRVSSPRPDDGRRSSRSAPWRWPSAPLIVAARPAPWRSPDWSASVTCGYFGVTGRGVAPTNTDFRLLHEGLRLGQLGLVEDGRPRRRQALSCSGEAQLRLRRGHPAQEVDRRVLVLGRRR